MPTPLIVNDPVVVEISFTGIRISFCADALAAKPAESMAVLSQLATALLVKLAPAASSSAGNAVPFNFKAPFAITVIVPVPLFVKLGKAPPLNRASAVTTELPSSRVSITALAVLPRDQLWSL